MSFRTDRIVKAQVDGLPISFLYNTEIVKAPSGGSGWAAGKYLYVLWCPNNALTYCKLFYSNDKIHWSSEDIPISSDDFYPANLAVDSQGNIYLLFGIRNTGMGGADQLIMKVKTSSWQADEIVEDVGYKNYQWSAIFVDAYDNVYFYSFHINSGYGDHSWHTQFVKRNGVNSYSFTTVASGTAISFNFTAIFSGVKSNGDFWLVYGVPSSGNYFYTEYNGSSWSSAVPLDVPVDGYATLARVLVDNNGVIHVLYRDITFIPYAVKYAYGSSGSWSTPYILVPQGTRSYGFDMGIDQSGIIQLLWTLNFSTNTVDWQSDTYRKTVTNGVVSGATLLKSVNDPIGNDATYVLSLMNGRYPSSMTPDIDFVGILYGDTTPDNYTTEFNEYSLMSIEYNPEPVPNQFSVVLSNPRTPGIFKLLNKSIKSLEWEFNVVGGCGICTATFALPFEYKSYLQPDMNIKIYDTNENGDIKLFYQGYLESQEPLYGANDQINLSFTGYSGQLKRVRVKKTYESMELSEIIKDVLDTYILPNTSITYDPADIVVTDYAPDVLEFDELGDSVVQTLSDLAGNFQWGVDRNKKFYFKPINPDIQHTLKIGKEVTAYDPIYDYSIIVNSLVVKGGRVNNIPFEETVQNTESQGLYGLRTNIVSNGSIVTSSVAQQYGTQLLGKSARIQVRSTVNITKNKKLFEETLSLGAFSLLFTPVPKVWVYNDTDAIYGNDSVVYGSRESFQAERISYKFADEGTEVTVTGGTQTPDISLHIKKLEAQINQLRSSQ